MANVVLHRFFLASIEPYTEFSEICRKIDFVKGLIEKEGYTGVSIEFEESADSYGDNIYHGVISGYRQKTPQELRVDRQNHDRNVAARILQLEQELKRLKG